MATQSESSSLPTRILAFALLAGAAVTTIEFAAVRLCAPYFGQSPLVWANVIAVVLVALAIGNAVGGYLAERCDARRTMARLALAAGVVTLVAPTFGTRMLAALPVAAGLGPDLELLVLGSLIGALVLFAPPIVLIGATSPLVLRAAAGAAGLGRQVGFTLAASTLGAVLGCHLTTLYMIPELGTRGTLCAAAIALLAAGLLAGGLTRGRVVVAASALAAMLALAPARSTPLREPVIAGDVLRFERESSLQLVRVIDGFETPQDGGGARAIRRLALDEGDLEYHSVRLAGRVDSGGRYYDALAALPSLLPADVDPVRVLIVGFAAGTAWRAMAHAVEGAGGRLETVGVEIDPEVIAAGRAHFDLPAAHDGLEIVIADGRAYVNALPAMPAFDIVIVDAYARQQYVPFHLATREFFAKLRTVLAPHGILALNVDCRTPAAVLPRAMATTVEAAGFPRVTALPVPDYPSMVLVTRAFGTTPLLPQREIAAPFDVVLRSWWPRAVAFAADDVTRPFDDDLAPIERLIDATIARRSSP
jgi:spermidine synthase